MEARTVVPQFHCHTVASFHRLLKVGCCRRVAGMMMSRCQQELQVGSSEPSLVQELRAGGVLDPPKVHPGPRPHPHGCGRCPDDHAVPLPHPVSSKVGHLSVLSLPNSTGFKLGFVTLLPGSPFQSLSFTSGLTIAQSEPGDPCPLRPGPLLPSLTKSLTS